MVELETEVSLAAVQLYLEKTPVERTQRLELMAREGLKILASKQEQFNDQDRALYARAIREIR